MDDLHKKLVKYLSSGFIARIQLSTNGEKKMQTYPKQDCKSHDDLEPLSIQAKTSR